MRNLGWNRHVEAMADRDRQSDVSPPPSAVAARIAKRIGESVGREAADDVETDTTHIAHPRHEQGDYEPKQH
jgi:hypothetical protein